MQELIYKIRKNIKTIDLVFHILASCIVFIFIVAGLSITESSVHVSGYTRGDGTNVSSYNRRPPGSVEHDQPFIIIRGLCIILIIPIGVRILKIWNIVINSDTISLVKTEIKWNLEYPKLVIPYREPPRISTIPRKIWLCDRCKNNIIAGSVYYHYGNNSEHICSACKNILEVEWNNVPYKKEKYEKEYLNVKSNRAKQLLEKYRNIFNKDLDNPEKYV